MSDQAKATARPKGKDGKKSGGGAPGAESGVRAGGGGERDGHAAGEHHGPGLGVYLGVFAALLVLTGVTVGAAFADLGRLAAPVAVGIAAVKGTLVVLYFMHVRYSSRLIGLYAASGFLFVAILLGITMSEVADRAPQPERDPLRPGVAVGARR